MKKTYTKEETTQAKIFWGLVLFWPLGVYLTVKHKPHAFRKAWFIVILAVYAFITSSAVVNGVMNGQDQSKNDRLWLQTVAVEKNRHYSISFTGSSIKEDAVTFDCDMQQSKGADKNEKYAGETDTLKCAKETVQGTFSNYKTVSLLAAGSSGSLKTDGDNFSIALNQLAFSQPDWEKGNIDFNALKNNGIEGKVTIVIKNNALGANIFSKTLAVRYKLSDSDIAQIKMRSDAYGKWKADEAAQKAKEEAAKKAAEEAKKQARETQPTESTTQSKPAPSSPSTTTPAPSSGGIVKMSTSGICHAPGDAYYDRTIHYTAYDTMQDCINAGGRPSER